MTTAEVTLLAALVGAGAGVVGQVIAATVNAYAARLKAKEDRVARWQSSHREIYARLLARTEEHSADIDRAWSTLLQPDKELQRSYQLALADATLVCEEGVERALTAMQAFLLVRQTTAWSDSYLARKDPKDESYRSREISPGEIEHRAREYATLKHEVVKAMRKERRKGSN